MIDGLSPLLLGRSSAGSDNSLSGGSGSLLVGATRLVLRNPLLDAARLRAQHSTVDLGPASESGDSQITTIELPVVIAGDDLRNLTEVASGHDLVKNDTSVCLSRPARSARDLGLERNIHTLALGASRDVNGAGIR